MVLSARFSQTPSRPTRARTPATRRFGRGAGDLFGVVRARPYRSHPALVIFGGGFTLYALDADTGTLFWKHVYDGTPSMPPSPTTDQTRIFSSPIVEDGNVYIGVDTDGESNERGYIVAANLLTGDPVWIYQTDVSAIRTDPRRRVRERLVLGNLSARPRRRRVHCRRLQ